MVRRGSNLAARFATKSGRRRIVRQNSGVPRRLEAEWLKGPHDAGRGIRGEAMKTTILAAAMAAALGVAGGPSQAQTDHGVYTPGYAHLQPAYVRVHSCVARSRFAVGYWTSASLALSRQRALVQCAVRTPRGFSCFVTRCT